MVQPQVYGGGEAGATGRKEEQPVAPGEVTNSVYSRSSFSKKMTAAL
jgi:hypothetical protein